VPDALQPDEDRSSRTAADRSGDHAAIDRLTEELLPALVAKLGATGLGELEIKEGAWRVRLRRAAGTQPSSGRDKRRERGGDRGEAGADRPGERGQDRGGRAGQAGLAGQAAHHPSEGTSTRSDSRTVATSPAVGIYRPRPELAAGTRVRAGDRIGAVDMLGVAQEVVAPVDGIVGASLAQSGDAVEYGQELIVIEFAQPPASVSSTGF